MNTENNPWLAFLLEQGAEFDGNRVIGFSDSQADSDNSLIPLYHQAILRISGSDSEEFLQGQTSNDVRLVNSGHHQLGSYCTPKGRMLALFMLLKRDDDYYLILPQELSDAVQKRLTMFVMRSDVSIENVSITTPAFAISGPGADRLLETALGQFPVTPGDSLSIDETVLLRRPGDNPSFICVGPTDKQISLWNALSSDASAASSDSWDLLEIRAGVPTVESGTVEAFVPQMTNLQLVDGVNFKKGCYPGQEVVARMQYLGKLKRRMYRASVDTQAPAAGTPLYSAESASGQGAGKVVRSASRPGGGSELLVVAEIESAEKNTLFLENEHGARLTLLDLPYAFEQSDN